MRTQQIYLFLAYKDLQLSTHNEVSLSLSGIFVSAQIFYKTYRIIFMNRCTHHVLELVIISIPGNQGKQLKSTWFERTAINFVIKT